MGLGWGSTGRALGALVMAAGSVVAVGGAPAAEAVPPAPRTPPAPTSPPEGVIPDLAARGWQAVFNEEFNGSAVNESVWYVREEDWHGVQARDSLSVSGGQLTVRTYTGADGINRTGTILTGGLGDHTPTWDGFEAAGGYIEARIKLPDGPTTESAFWTMSQNGNNSMPFGDPQADGPEIDIMEHSNGPDSKGDDDGDGDCDFNGQAESYGVPCNELIINNVHWDGFEEDHKSGPGFVENPTATPLQGNFHTYGLLWTPGTPGEYRWYLDGIETNRTTGGVSFTPAQLILTNFVRSGHDYGPLGAATNDQTVVDYVKVWQRPISEIPDQATAASSTLSVPFSVTDRAFGSPANAEPGSVVVTPTASSNTTLVPLANVAVAGNSPADPDGSLTNPGFESGTSGWTLTGGAAVNGTQEHLGTQALQLPQAGGRATQAITGLRPNTTYLVDAHYEIGIGLNDANGNGRADPGETFADPADKVGRFDWGIVDVDATAAGNQALRTSYSRNGTEEQGRPAYWRRQRWPQEVVKFTTGPATTSVTLYVDNQPFAAGGDDSDVSFDSIAVRPLVPHHRTVSVRPADGQVGESTITLTARDGANTVIGTEQFVVRVDAGSLRDGRFEQGDATSAWKILDGASAVHPDPFRADRQLRLAAGTALGTVGQTVTGLEPGVRYKVEATGRVAQSGGDVGVFVQGHGGAQVGTTITSTASTTQSFELVMGAANTTAELLILDWDTADGASYVEGVKLSKCTTPSSCAAVTTTVPSVAAPALGAVGPQSTVSGVPLDVRAQLPAGATLTGVTSTNETLIPTANIATTGTGVHRAFSATAVADRTGKATLRVAYTGATGSPVDIPVVVSEVGLRQPGFEKDGAGWTLTGGATIVTTGQRRGASALQVSGAGDARQKVPPGVIPPGQPLTLGAWVNGTATVTVQTVRPSDTGSDANEQPMVLATANWTGSGYTERQVDLSTLQVTDGNTGRWRGLEVVITDTNTGDGQAVRVDDLHLVHRPVIRRIRDLSLHSGQTAFSYDARRYTTSGRMPANGFWDPTAYTVSTADITGFGTGVLPAANLSALQMNFSGWPYTAFHESRAGTETGRGRVTVQATDAATGRSTSQSYEVTVNAGNNFRHGDFERGTEGALNGGWTHAWMNDSAEIRHRQTWQFLGEKNSGWPLVGPVDFDKALRITSGVVKFTDGTTPLITGLTPGTQYKVKLRAKGNGSLVKVTTHDNVVFAPVLGSVAITPPDSSNVWRDYEVTFTTPASGTGSTSVALYLADDNVSDTTGDGVVDAADAVPASGRYCAQFVAGQTCFDDIGVFKATDVP